MTESRRNVTLLSVLERLLSSDTALEATERDVIEGWIAYARRREGAVELAATVAHDLSNLLTGVMGAAELLRRRDLDEEARWEIDAIFDGVTRSRALCRQLVSVARAASRPREDVVLSELVDAMVTMLRHLVGSDVRIEVTHQPDHGTVHCDPGEIEQVVVNLALNARDAMPAGGVLYLHTDVGEAPSANDGAWPSGSCAVLTVSDTGLGMTDEVRARAFEPNYTTKPSGSGLGLSSCLRIVTQLGGRMELESEVGVGTTVRVYFPRHDAG